jgi:fumarate reductase subunit D
MSQQPAGNQSSVQGDKNIGSPQAKDTTTEAFWKSFTAFSSPRAKFCVQYWYILFIGYYSALFLIALLKDIDWGIRFKHDAWFLLNGGNFQQSSTFAQFQWIGGAISFLIVVLGSFFLLALYKRWVSQIPRFFRCLEQKHARINSADQDYQPYHTAYQSALLYIWGVVPKSIVLAGIFCISLIIFGWFGGVEDYAPKLFSNLSTYGLPSVVLEISRRLVKDVFYPSLFVYLAAGGIWTMAITGLYIQKFTSRFPLEIQPQHEDHCGGLKFLGNFLFKMFLLIMISSAILALYIQYRSQYPGATIWSISASVIALCGLFLSYAVFFVPMSAVHRNMLEKRQAYEDLFESRTNEIEERIRDGLHQGNTQQLQLAEDELKQLQTQSPEKLGYVNWPFDRHLLFVFLGSHVAPVIAFLLPLADFALKIFKR